MSNEATVLPDDQARTTIREDLSRTLFVEAGAGTGKTSALVGRILNLVLTNDDSVRVPLSQIAAITFTNAAAAELRERIRLKFEEALSKAHEKEDQALIERCEEALADADIAAIQTLHGFAYRLLSEYPVEVGIPPRVEIIDDVQSQLAFDERWSAFLDALYEDPTVEEFIVRASILGMDLAGHGFRSIAEDFDSNWDRLSNVSPPNGIPTPLNFDGIREAIFAIEALDLPDDESDGLVKKIRTAEGLFARFRHATSDHQKLRVVAELADGPTFKGAGNKKNWGAGLEDAKETWIALGDPIERLLASVANQTLREITSRIAAFTRKSAEERCSEGVLENQDLLVLALQLLQTSPEARAGLSSRYSVLMLDEFQDTDPIQISLALLLASSFQGPEPGPWNELEAEAGRLFMVGDPKQSIYRFRRADIQLFLEARAKFADGAASLECNFRTVEPVIDAINGLFAEVMAVDSELQAKYSPLIPQRQPSPTIDHRPLVLGQGHSGKADERRKEEAADVAAVIAEIRDHPERWLVGDGKDADGNDKWRKPVLSDVTILLPRRTSLQQLSVALDAHEIPFRADKGDPVYETQEVRDLLHVLKAVDDPSNEIAMVAALISPLYACGYDDLYAFTSAGGKFSIDAVIPDEAAGTPVAVGIEHLREIARRKWWDEPSELLVQLIDERYAMALPAQERRSRDIWRRLRYVVDQARAFAEAGGGDLRAYLEWTDLQGYEGSRATEKALPEADDVAVQIMTIHGSKGLEFPITILSGMDASTSHSSRGAEVLWGNEGELPEIKLKGSLKTSGFDDLLEPEAENTEPEMDRLLYVALTRARDHLVISGYHAVNKKGEPAASLGAKVHAWAADAGSELVRRLDATVEVGLPSDGSPKTDNKTNSPPPLIASHAEWAEAHKQRLVNGSARSTISATGLAHSVAAGTDVNAVPAPDVYAGTAGEFVFEDDPADDDEPEAGDLPPRIFRRGRAGTAIGTAVHGVLQFLDLANPDEGSILSLSESQAWAESVPEHLETIRGAVRSVLDADIVKACATHQHHKELYVAAPVGSITVEGYVDLLVETPEGLVVVDYKTDTVNSEAEVDAKLAHYALQGTAYALAIESATGMTVCDVQFIFAKPGGPIVRSVTDLDAQRNAVLTAVGQLSA